jgi:hypothetical protein
LAAPSTHIPSLSLGIWLLLNMGLGAVCPSPEMSSSSHYQFELLRDARFSLGFKLIEPAPGKKAFVKNLQAPGTKAEPQWYLCQWHSRHCLGSAPRVVLAPGTVECTNHAKSLRFGQGSDEVADLVLGVDARAEYQGRMRQNGQAWPHLLIEQDDVSIHPFRDVARIDMHIEARLLKHERFELSGYTPKLHTAQFQLTLIIQNRNRESPGFGDFIWFNVQIYDERQRFSPLNAAQDTADPSAKMIYAPPTALFTDRSVHDGDWVSFSKDIYPVMQEALDTARARGYLSTSPNNADFAVSSVILGWEVPGISCVEMQVRNLCLNLCSRSDSLANSR